MNYDFIKSNINDVKKFTETLDVKTLNNSPNKAPEKHTAFIHSYSELAQEIRRITASQELTQQQKDKLLNEVADAISTLTAKLKEIN